MTLMVFFSMAVECVQLTSFSFIPQLDPVDVDALSRCYNALQLAFHVSVLRISGLDYSAFLIKWSVVAGLVGIGLLGFVAYNSCWSFRKGQKSWLQVNLLLTTTLFLPISRTLVEPLACGGESWDFFPCGSAPHLGFVAGSGVLILMFYAVAAVTRSLLQARGELVGMSTSYMPALTCIGVEILSKPSFSFVVVQLELFLVLVHSLFGVVSSVVDLTAGLVVTVTLLLLTIALRPTVFPDINRLCAHLYTMPAWGFTCGFAKCW